MKKEVLIIGGNGFVGSNLILEMMENGYLIHVIDQIPLKIEGEICDKIKFYNGNLENKKLIEEIMLENKIELVVHLVNSIIPNSNYNEFIEEMKNIVIPTYELLNIMEKNNVSKIVFFSSGGTVYGDSELKNENIPLSPLSFYGYSKQIIEEYLQLKINSKIKYLILRPSNPFGKFQNINGKQGLIAVTLKKLLNGEEIIIYGDGTSVRDYIAIEDLVKITCQLIKNNNWNEVYNIGSGTRYSVNEIVNKLEKITGIKGKITYLTERNNDVKEVLLDISKLKTKLENYSFLGIDESLNIFFNHIRNIKK